MTTGRINQGTVTAVRVPPRGPQGHPGTSSYLLLLLSAHSRTCRPAHTRQAPQVLCDEGTRLQSEILRLPVSRPGSWRADCMRQVRRASCRIGPRPKAGVRDVAMTVNHIAGRRTARSSSLSLFLHMYQMNRREPRRERVASRGRSGTRRWSTERIDHRQAIRVYTCFREGRIISVRAVVNTTLNSGTVRPECPPTTSLHDFENIPRQVCPPTTSLHVFDNFPRQVCPPTTSRHVFENIPRRVCPPTTSRHVFENIPRRVYLPTMSRHVFEYIPRQVCFPTTSRHHFEIVPRQVCSPTSSLHAFEYISMY
jgi:hypothetical protein